MNISQPVSSAVDSVEFCLLSDEEIKAVSVRRIENEITFDTLLNPVPGGLYDPALGSWGNTLCATCGLGQSMCPGHPGHIELPVPVYHPVFMDQVLQLVRAQCVYCHRFRLRSRERNRYVCKLRLLQHGLLFEAGCIDAIGEGGQGVPVPGLLPAELEVSEDDEGTGEEAVVRARNGYVRRVLRGRRTSVGEIRRGKHEGASESRKTLMKEFAKEIGRSTVCAHCSGISPGYRKDRSVKIFEKALTAKEKARMAAGQFKQRDALALRQVAKPSMPGHHDDEGIADIDLPTTDEEEEGGSEEDSRPVDELDERGKLLARSPNMPPKSGHADVRQRYISAQEVMERLRLLFDREQELLGLVFSSQALRKRTGPIGPDMFFIRTLLVPPNRYRPEARTGDSQVTEAQQNSLYKLILGAASRLSQVHREIGGGRFPDGRNARDMTNLHEAWTVLQECVNSLVDRNKNPVQGQAGRRNEDGIKQKLEKKEGLFRKNLMGKRVNYAARSVISPDPNIETNEIGVPPVFALKLTYPEPVTSHNFRDMQTAVVNGFENWPGASAIENENGQIVNLRNKSLEERVSLANQLLAPTSSSFSSMRNKKVHRHLSNGDVVLMNRQPTLHKPSIMGHRVRVLPGEKTIRMHYANCNTYNADFDGDEMNMHFPQNEIARAEALQLADTDHQYLSGTQGNPLRGLIQDHISVSVALCSKDMFLSRSEYQQLIYGALRPEAGQVFGDRIELVAPAVVKPVVRWTGKQVISTVLMNIRPPSCGNLWMSGKSQIPGDRWGCHTEESQVDIQNSVLVSGILDKSQLGPSSGGLIHSVHELYGAAVAGKLLSCMGRLLTKLLNMRAFTCGMDDLRLTPAGEADRRRQLAAAGNVGLAVAANYVLLGNHKPSNTDPELLRRLEDVMRDDSKQEGLDLLVTKGGAELSDKVTLACLPAGLQKQFPNNHMQAMTVSGAKGGPVNANQISCNLGQQVLEGRRVPLMVSGKSLPCFAPFDTDIRAGGFVASRFLTGIRPQEYYFHHMAGREGLIDTAVKTSRSGYLQRCLIKGMEGLQVAYDTSVRDSDGTLVQFLYGEDGLDVAKQKYLTDFGFLLRNLESQINYVRFSDPETVALFQHRDALVKQTRQTLKKSRSDPTCADEPVNSLFNPARHAFATSESFFEAMTDYVKQNRDGLIRERDGEDGRQGVPIPRTRMAKKVVEKIFAAKYLRSLVEPGEAVGVIAGQSVGEPSTQMTLNTFHLAGHSARNVTLGIPRLREILMTASANIATPTMTLVLNPELSAADGERFAKSISILPLSRLVDTIMVRERTTKGVAHELARIYDIRLRLFGSANYSTLYAIGIADVLDAVETKMVPILCALVDKEAHRKAAGSSNAAMPEVGVKAGVVEVAVAKPGRDAGQGEDEDAQDEDDGDGDATNARERANRSEAVSYGPNDNEDDAVQMQMERDAVSGDEDEGFGGSMPATPGRVGDDPPDNAGSQKAAEKTLLTTRETRVKSNNQSVSKFRCDEELGEWCEMTLEYDLDTPKVLMLDAVQDAAWRCRIQEVHGVGACSFAGAGDRRGSQEAVVHAEGTNLRAMQQYVDYVNPHRIATNDIAAILDIYGVEACQGNIIREIHGVFSGHGIRVDRRHLSLIAAFITRNGGFTPFNRMGLKGSVSPFTKMSFETTLAFLKEAVLDGDWDNLATPSSRLVTGKLGRTGTGAFDVLTRVPMQHHDGLVTVTDGLAG